MSEVQIGTTRKIDAVSRITLPNHIKEFLGVDVGYKVELLVVGKDVVIRRKSSYCSMCGKKATHILRDTLFCTACLDFISEKYEAIKNTKEDSFNGKQQEDD